MNTTGIICFILAVICFFALRSIYKKHKYGGCCGCDNCPMSSECKNKKGL